MTNLEAAARETRAWLERAVIGLNLCPFAKAVYVKGQVHVAVTAAVDAEGVLDALEAEVSGLLGRAPQERDTTLLVAPAALADFLEFNDVVTRGERLLRRKKLEGVLQLASFHPGFCFADVAADDTGNYTNRSPHPTLQLLREESLDRAVAAYPDPAAIYERNIETLERLGVDGWRALMGGSEE